MIDDLWKANQPIEELMEKVKIALITLSDKQLQKEKSK